MPELPEVETVMRSLKPHLNNTTIHQFHFYAPKLRHPLVADAYRELAGARVGTIFRRAKYIICPTDKNHHLIIHLGMTGSIRIELSTHPKQKHDHIELILNADKTMRYNDPRRFGQFLWQSAKHYSEFFKSYGPEPFSTDFTGAYLYQLSRNRQAAVKNFIMDQRIVVGVGNIYANEALFRGRIHPRRAAGKIGLRRYEALASHIRDVLHEAIAEGGTTISDFRGVDGSQGRFSINLSVYDKAGKTCNHCGKHSIKRVVIGGRASYYCPQCQH
jgi:formamidopyrimidine-DNA glycosylase